MPMLSRAGTPILCCVLMLMSINANAESAETKTAHSITLKEAVTRTLAYNPQLAVIDHQRKFTRYKPVHKPIPHTFSFFKNKNPSS